jgi:hypothetical protein
MVGIRGYHRGGSSGLGRLFLSGCLIIGAGEQLRRNVDVERPGGLEN